ncbi:MAG TPA: class I SAM-dependent methyltransferase [Acidimicrobiia bacterium]|nr:class I SAM-dependent methyltransferase [Acidimicrobiia bacterium]
MSERVETFADRVFASALGAVEIYSIHIGDRLGFYRVLASGAKTGADLAASTGVAERYVREWLEQQATYGVLDVDLDGQSPVFTLPGPHAEVLTDELNGSYLAPLARMLTTAGEKMALLLEAYRSGEGVSWEMYGQDMRESQADMNRPFFENDLADLFAGFGPVHQLLSRPGARVADIGCGAGWSTLALARAYPEATIHGYDIDGPSVEMATQNAIFAGLDERVTFSSADIAEPPREGGYDVVVAFETIHDMAQPVQVLSSVRKMISDDGLVVIMDEAVADTFTGGGDEIEKLMYGFSILICLPDGLSSKPSAGTGTVMRPSTLRRYAEEAGFTGFGSLGEAGFFRFYQLSP